jgi:alanine racemase
LDDWTEFRKGGWAEKLGYELKFNTGMNRLGIPVSAAGRIGRELAKMEAGAHPSGVLSHLAIGEDPDCSLSRQQREKFLFLRAELSGVAPSAQFHLAASAAIWNRKSWGLDGLTDAVRPGLSLYGVVPWSGAPARGIAPVLTLRASVTAVHRLKPGESTGYGARFQVQGTEARTVAILGAGYGDGIHRSLSGLENRGGGYVWLDGAEQRVLGTVSMDLCAVSCAGTTEAGSWAEFLGPHVDVWAQARAAGTIPYELLTSLASRVQRIYG